MWSTVSRKGGFLFLSDECVESMLSTSGFSDVQMSSKMMSIGVA
jgi:hypothetical protein